MDFVRLLHSIQTLEDLPALMAALRQEPLWDPVPHQREPVVVVGRGGDFAWYALSGAHADRRASAFAARMAARGRICGVLGLDSQVRRLSIAVSLDDAPRFAVALDAADASSLSVLARIATLTPASPGYAVQLADALGGAGVGHRFFREFRATLERMAVGLPGPLAIADRHSLALLQLTRVLFLYFVQAKGWLAGNDRFLSQAVDGCLARRRRIHRDLLRPLFFGTLNRPAQERTRIARGFGGIPFLNGGLFEPHRLERRVRADIPNAIWRDAFDHLFERFHFTVSEGDGAGIAPDMLGRVFEGVMAPDERRASGSYYTPAVLVDRLLKQCFAALLKDRLHCSWAEAEQRLADADPAAVRCLRGIRILDPAVGSGAFLLGALNQLAVLASGPLSATQRRRRILQRNLFGVDKNASAVQLTELRLWLAVIADDPTDTPELVQPLPNLGCLVRQGDSLFDPAGSAAFAIEPGLAKRLAQLRAQVVSAAGADKRECLRQLARVEVAVADASLEAAEGASRRATEECLEMARGSDLFGQRRGLGDTGRRQLTELRRQLREVRARRRALGSSAEVPWFDYRVHFADVFAGGGFDLVVGNPPWLRAEELPEELRRRLSGRYRWWRAGGRGYANRPDLAVAFLERSLELTAPGGATAMLLPAKIATAGYGAAVRHGLASEMTLRVVADLTGNPDAAFEATVYPLALVAQKQAPPPRHRVRIGLAGGAGVSQAGLRGGGPWIIGEEPLRDALAAVRGDHPRLDASIACHLGLKTGANGLFLDPPSLEEDVMRWALRGRDLRAFQPHRRTRLLWTHDQNGVPLPRLPPRAAEYIRAHIKALRARKDYVGGPPWTLFRIRAVVAPHRVVWADLAGELRAASLTGLADTIPLNSCYVALPASDDAADRLAGWLNSSWLRAAARAGAVPAAGDCARFTAGTVGALPLPQLVLADQDLLALNQAARAGASVQADLDDITARHLDLGARHRVALLRSLGRHAPDRR